MAALRSALDTRTTLGFARLAGIGGSLLALAGLALTLLFWVLVSTDDAVPTRMETALTMHALLAPVSLLGVLLSSRSLFLATLVLLAAFVGSFVLGFGWYLVLLPSPLALIGVGGLLYGVSAVMMIVAGIMRRSPGGAVREGRS